MSITSKVEINVKISDLKSNGRSEITTKTQLKKFPKGSLISYLRKDKVFKIGGYLFAVKDEWFIFLTIDCKQKVRVRFCNVDKMYVGDVFKVTRDIISFKNECKKSNYSVKIGDHTVYYGASLFNTKRYMATARYQKMVNWYNYFHSKSESE